MSKSIDIKNEALRKVGRNVVNFQKMEGMLKQVVSESSFSGPIREIKAQLEDRRKSIKRQSMGKLAEEYFKTFTTDVSNIHEHPKEVDDIWVSFTFNIEHKDGAASKQKEALSLMISERNNLIHKMLVGFNPESVESCEKLIVELDNQNKMIEIEFKKLKTILNSLHEARTEAFKELVNNITKKEKDG